MMKKCPLSYMRTAGGARIAWCAIIVSKKTPTSSRSPPHGGIRAGILNTEIFVVPISQSRLSFCHRGGI